MSSARPYWMSTRALRIRIVTSPASATVEAAVLADLAARTPGATRRTSEVGDAIAARASG